jgi:hypothetical protein
MPGMVKRRRKRTNGMLMWISIGVVVVVVLAIVLVTVVFKSGPQQSYFGLTSPAVLQEVQSVPASVFNTVGVTTAIQVTGLAEFKSQPPLSFTAHNKKLPGALYVGAEYCPYCAGTRWGIIVALSRFGKFNKLYNMLSSDSDYAPSTATFSFVGKKPTDVVTYTSKYLAFVPLETLTRNGTALMTPTRSVDNLIQLYDTVQGQTGGIPFLDLNNRWVIQGSEFDPINLANQSRNSIAAGLRDPSIPVTQAIITTANLVSAGICAMTKSQPTSVCHSSGVLAAAKAMKIKL